jgi:hypothetical protein
MCKNVYLCSTSEQVQELNRQQLQRRRVVYQQSPQQGCWQVRAQQEATAKSHPGCNFHWLTGPKQVNRHRTPHLLPINTHRKHQENESHAALNQDSNTTR